MRFLNKIPDNIFRFILIEWTKTIQAGGDFTVEKFPEKERKLNYTIHNPNTVEDTAKMLLDILIEANQKKVESKMRELLDCHEESDLDEEERDIAQ